MNGNSKIRVLIIHSSATPPRPEPRKNMEYHLSSCCEGDLLARHWGKRKELPDKPMAEIYDSLGAFEYHPTFDAHLPSLVKLLSNLYFYIRQGLKLSRRKGKYDVIVTYGPYTCLMAALVIRFFTGSKVIVMLPAPPIESFRQVPGRMAKVKLKVASWIVPAMIRWADGVWMLYPSQLETLPGHRFPPQFVFPDFVPVSTISELSRSVDNPVPRYIYFLGHPFERKGVDILIKAFHKISAKHADVVLKLVGHCPNLEPYRKLAQDSPRIIFKPGVLHHEAMELMDKCAVFVLPSRLEGVPRVVEEAMACKRPVVASRIQGTPTLIEDGVSGLLFESEDVEGLATQLDRILSDDEFARRLGNEAQQRILSEFSEERFVEFFEGMTRTVSGKTVSPATVSAYAPGD